MCPIELARAMRARGWHRARISKGVANFGIRFPSGFGVMITVSLRQVWDMASMTPTEFADLLTRDAALTAKWDMRAAGAR